MSWSARAIAIPPIPSAVISRRDVEPEILEDDEEPQNPYCDPSEVGDQRR